MLKDLSKLQKEKNETVRTFSFFTFTFYFQVMNAARQISRRFGRSTGARTRSAADYSIAATISVVPDPLEADVDYIRLNWDRFSKVTNKCYECKGWVLPEEIDYKLCAEVLHGLSDCISYKHPVEVCAALQKVFTGEDEFYAERLRRLIVK